MSDVSKLATADSAGSNRVLTAETGLARFSMGRLVTHTRLPLYRNAYAWMVSTAVSSGLGIIYWIMAARYYSAEIVGVSAALISAMIFLSGVSQLNLMSALIRFIPTAGPATGRLVGYAYAVTIFIAALLGLLIIVGFCAWSSGLSFLDANPDFALWFVAATMIWSIFALQDSVLTGLRDAVWVPVENISYAVAKIILLVLFASSLPQYGIFASWMVPVMLTILPINILIFRRLIPKHVQSTQDQVVPIRPGQVLMYTAGNYISSLFLLATTRLLPVIVAYLAGAAASAYFYLPWTIANALKLIATQMTMSLTVEGARDDTKLKADSYRFLINTLLLLLPAVIVLVLGAPTILRLSGNDYAAGGTTVLRLMSLSVIPSLATVVYISVARVQKRVAGIIAVQGVFSLLVLGLSYVLLPLHGITGVGIAMLVSETVVAVALLLMQLRPRMRPLVQSEWMSSSHD